MIIANVYGDDIYGGGLYSVGAEESSGTPTSAPGAATGQTPVGSGSGADQDQPQSSAPNPITEQPASSTPSGIGDVMSPTEQPLPFAALFIGVLAFIILIWLIARKSRDKSDSEPTSVA